MSAKTDQSMLQLCYTTEFMMVDMVNTQKGGMRATICLPVVMLLWYLVLANYFLLSTFLTSVVVASCTIALTVFALMCWTCCCYHLYSTF